MLSPHLQPELWAQVAQGCALAEWRGGCLLPLLPPSLCLSVLVPQGPGKSLQSQPCTHRRIITGKPLSLFRSGGWRLGGHGFRALTPGPRPFRALGPHSAPSCQALGDGGLHYCPDLYCPRPCLGPVGLCTGKAQGAWAPPSCQVLTTQGKGSPCNVGPTWPLSQLGDPPTAAPAPLLRHKREPACMASAIRPWVALGVGGANPARTRTQPWIRRRSCCGSLWNSLKGLFRAPRTGEVGPRVSVGGGWRSQGAPQGASRKPALPAPPAPRPEAGELPSVKRPPCPRELPLPPVSQGAPASEQGVFAS